MTTLKRTLVLMMLAMFSLASTSFAASTMEKIVKSGELIVAVQTQGPPVSFIDKTGQRTGLVIDIMEMMAADMGVKLILQDYDWKGLIPALTSGKADVIAADMTPTAKRHMQVIFTEPVFFAENIVYSLKDRDFVSWKDVNKPEFTVGATQASSYAEVAKKFLPAAKLKEYSGGNPQTFQALVSGRVDAGVSDRASVSGLISQNPNVKVLEGTVNKEPLGFAVRPDSIHLLHALNNYMRLIRHDGRLDRLLDYWWNSTVWEADHK
ncbi:polar amino acid transport system substrate-binding protein [Desulfuromusa kysingii]|uniref:Polar amino acid transport system substrate-binding protein n=1 Tax=Desulfuromusa kysingii TaxID=37625 RepID=A0A1H4D1Q3_9BACT|nr:ABC transporter substrate-binding protein [Desulfuromusa kysingii]SEA66713.1 polar amino acid transport system substrate-binding protein [Desulfuromusa kysingii]